MHKNTPLFKHKFKLSNFLLFTLLFFTGIILFRKITMFFVISLIVAIFTYFNYSIKLPFDLSPVLVISLIISRQYSLIYSIIFIIISGILPMIFAGGSFDQTTLYYVSIRILVNFVNTILKPIPAIPVLIAMSITDHLLGTIGSITLFGANISKELINIVLQTLVDIIYIFSLSSFLILLLK